MKRDGEPVNPYQKPAGEMSFGGGQTPKKEGKRGEGVELSFGSPAKKGPVRGKNAPKSLEEKVDALTLRVEELAAEQRKVLALLERLVKAT